MQTKIETALKTLRKNVWISSENIKKATGEEDLRSVRRLRENGHDIMTRRSNTGFQYKRVN